MKNAGLAGAIALCGIGLIMIGLGSVVATPHAMGTTSDDFSPSSDSRGDLVKRKSSQKSWRAGTECFLPGDPVTWAVFDPQIRPLELIRGSDQLQCFYIENDSVDLDGDGFTELANSDSPGFELWSGDMIFRPFSVLRNTPDGVALETVLEIETDLQYWEELTGLEGITGIEARVKGYFDVDRDGLPDALMLLRAGSGAAQDFQQYSGFFWYRNQLTPPGDRIAGDVNNDGLVNGADLTIVLSDWTI